MENLNKGPTGKFKQVVFFMMVLVALLIPSFTVFAPTAEALGLAAGTNIGNQASATYEDSTGNTFTSTSNLVTTIVQPVRGLTITPNGTTGSPGQSQNATPGAIVYYPYTLTNTGNDTDSFTFTTALGVNTFTPSNTKVYWDKNGNGIVDVGDTLLTVGVTQVGPILADGVEKLIVEYQVPSNASNGNSAEVNLIGTSVGDGTKVDNDNFNRTTVLNDAVITITKTVDQATTDPSNTLTYTFTVNNTGNNTATNIDVLDMIPTYTDYIVGSQTGPVGMLTTLYNDVVPATPPVSTITPANGVNSSVTYTKFRIPSLAAGNSRTITFQVQVESTAPQATISNFAVFGYDKVTAPIRVADANTNTVNTVINMKSAVLLTYSSAPFASQLTTGSDAASTDDTAIANVPAGTFVYFINKVTNNGNATDTFDISLNAAMTGGYTASFYQLTDAVTPANNLNPLIGNTTGPLAPAASFEFVTKVFVPANASAGQTAVVKATSTNGGSAKGATPGQTLSDTTRDTVTNVLVPGVDITNITNNGVLSDGNIILSTSADGTTVAFPLNVRNTGGSSDTFNLSVPTIPGSFNAQFYPIASSVKLSAGALINATTVSVASTTGLAAGDTVIINGQSLTIASLVANTSITFAVGQSLAKAALANDTVIEPGTLAITSVGPLATTASQDIIAIITVPAGTTAGDYPVAFRATSNNDVTKMDTVTDTVRVNQYRNFTLVANRNGSAPAGGVLFYDHTLTNTGNIAEDFNLALASGAFTYQLLDTSNNPIAAVAALAPGASVNFKVKVIVPAGTATGTVDNAVVRATETTATTFQENTDQTTVVAGFISLVKTVTNLTSFAGDGTKAYPGDILEYRIDFTNVGAIDANKVKIVDGIPANTTFQSGTLTINGNAKTNAQDAEGATGSADYNVSTASSVTFYVGSGATSVLGGVVVPGGTGYVTFRVQVN